MPSLAGSRSFGNLVPRYVYAVGSDFEGSEVSSPEIHSRLDLFVRDLLDGPVGYRAPVRAQRRATVPAVA